MKIKFNKQLNFKIVNKQLHKNYSYKSLILIYFLFFLDFAYTHLNSTKYIQNKFNFSLIFKTVKTKLFLRYQEIKIPYKCWRGWYWGAHEYLWNFKIDTNLQNKILNYDNLFSNYNLYVNYKFRRWKYNPYPKILYKNSNNNDHLPLDIVRNNFVTYFRLITSEKFFSNIYKNISQYNEKGIYYNYNNYMDYVNNNTANGYFNSILYEDEEKENILGLYKDDWQGIFGDNKEKKLEIKYHNENYLKLADYTNYLNKNNPLDIIFLDNIPLDNIPLDFFHSNYFSYNFVAPKMLNTIKYNKNLNIKELKALDPIDYEVLSVKNYLRKKMKRFNEIYEILYLTTFFFLININLIKLKKKINIKLNHQKIKIKKLTKKLNKKKLIYFLIIKKNYCKIFKYNIHSNIISKKKNKLSLIRSPFIYKKSREQFITSYIIWLFKIEKLNYKNLKKIKKKLNLYYMNNISNYLGYQFSTKLNV